jgi:hypothetical protein
LLSKINKIKLISLARVKVIALPEVILEQVTVLNLDTGERVALSVAEDKLPQCVNPLSLHIMRLTSEYVRYCQKINKHPERHN